MIDLCFSFISQVEERLRFSCAKKITFVRTVFENKKASDFRQTLSVNLLEVRLPAATLSATAFATSAATATAVASSATAVASTAAAIAATTVAAATAAASATAVATTTARGTSFTRSRFVDRQRPAFHRLAVEFRDRFLRILFRGHRHEGKAARFTRELILHERDFLHRARLSEKILEIGFGRVEGKISYV